MREKQISGEAGPIQAGVSQPGTSTGRQRLFSKTSYSRWLPAYMWQVLTRRPARGPVHLIIAIADHFEPSVLPGMGRTRASYDEQERRLEAWCREYPKTIESYRDSDGRPFSHTYFYPAEQYEKTLVEQLANHCHSGWGEIEIHLHHGADKPDTAANTRAQLINFRDALAFTHGALSYLEGSRVPQYAFVHGNFALANSAGGRACGVDDELQVLAETGCYADLTMPTAAFHSAQTAKVNSLYECSLPLSERAAHRRGRDLRRGIPPSIFPLMIQGPLVITFAGSARNGRIGIENAALTGANPPSLQRLRLWKKAGISVQGRPDWLFIKLHCHSMDPTDRDAVIGQSFQRFLSELVEGAANRGETIHFVTAREMTNIIWAACDGKEGDPGAYRDYRLVLNKQRLMAGALTSASLSLRG